MSFTPASSWKQFGVFTLSLSKEDEFWMSFLDNSRPSSNEWYIFSHGTLYSFFLHQHYFWLKEFPSSLLSHSIFLPLQENLRNHSYSLSTPFSPEVWKLQLVFSWRRCYCLFALAVFFWISSSLKLALSHYWAKTQAIRFKPPLGLIALILKYF